MRRFLTLVLLLTACEAPTAPNDREDLARARARWQALGSESYSFDLDRGCFCVLAGRRITITVQNGAVLAAEYQDSKDAVESVLLTYLPTVPDLFDLIQDAFDRNAASLVVSYDPSYSYPTRIEIDYSATTADDQISLTISDLAFLPAASSP
jgi:hypothetical protein